MIELENRKILGYTGKIYATKNAYEIARYIIGREEDTRILFDKNINIYFVGDAGEHIHRCLVYAGWKSGLYYAYSINTEEDFISYFGQTEFVFLYYYKDVPYKPNLTGDYEIHYTYDFGILDSHDIIKGTKLRFENTELYKILQPRLVSTAKEKTKIES